MNQNELMAQAAAPVRWCTDEDCKLYGIDSDEPKKCKVCGKKLLLLKWTLVLCEPRGIYMGLVSWPAEVPPEIMAYNVRNCVYYKTGGSQGLATVGPPAGSRVTGAVSELLLQKPKYFARVTAKALESWEQEPWT